MKKRSSAIGDEIFQELMELTGETTNVAIAEKLKTTPATLSRLLNLKQSLSKSVQEALLSLGVKPESILNLRQAWMAAQNKTILNFDPKNNNVSIETLKLIVSSMRKMEMIEVGYSILDEVFSIQFKHGKINVKLVEGVILINKN